MVEYEAWDAPPSLFDKLPNSIQGIEVDVVNPGEPDEKVYVYVSVRRVGIEVLQFLPDAAVGQRLQHVRRIQVSEDPWDLQIAQNSLGIKTLVVAGYRGGFSIYED